MKKNILIVLIITTIALVSWLNPFSWFKEKPMQPPVAETIVVTPVQSQNAAKSIPTQSEEKTVIKTIIVQDPALQTQINALITENANLKAQINSLTNQLNAKEPVSIVVDEEECTSDVNVTTEKERYLLSAQKSQNVVFTIKLSSNCTMDGKNVILKILKHNNTYFSPITLPVVGSIKSNSQWDAELIYSKTYTRSDAGNYEFSFIFEGKKKTIPLEIVDGGSH